jgi:peptidyl-tRNA hydrolase
MLKQYVFIPRKMATGKACSQVAHATFMALSKERPGIVRTWKDSGMCVIVLQVEHWQRLRDVEKYCKDWKIIHHLYNDESEALKPTCLATGIITEDSQWMFNKFKLYK